MSFNHNRLRSILTSILALCLLALSFTRGYAREEPPLSKPLIASWRYRTTAALQSTPGGSSEAVFLPLAGGEIVALASKTGRTVWRAEVGGEFSAPPIAEERGVYIATRKSIKSVDAAAVPRAAASLRRLSTTSGLTRWVTDMPYELIRAPVISGAHLFLSDTENFITSLDKQTGVKVWSQRFDSKITTELLVAAGRLYFGTEDGGVYAIDGASGRIVWQRRVRANARAEVIAVGTRGVFVGANDKRVYLFDPAGGEQLWRKSFDSGVRYLAAVAGGVVVSASDNALYLVDERRGKEIWKRRLQGRITVPPLVADNSVLVAPLGAEACVVFETQTGRIINTVPTGDKSAPLTRPLFAGTTLVLTGTDELMGYTAAATQGAAASARAP